MALQHALVCERDEEVIKQPRPLRRGPRRAEVEAVGEVHGQTEGVLHASRSGICIDK